MVPAEVLHDSALRMGLDYAGVAVFAATGALAAARRGYDIVTFAFFAAVTGIGGGTLRDLLLGAPVFWVANPGYMAVCIAAAGAVWAVGERLSRFRSLLWLDALGLAAYCVVGASKAADWGAPPLVAGVMGVLSATFGGVVRDVLAGEASVLLRKEIYVTAAVLGATVFVVLRIVGAPEVAAGGLGIAAAFALRAAAITRHWTLPGFGRPDVIAPWATSAVPLCAPASSAAISPPPTDIPTTPVAPKARRAPKAKAPASPPAKVQPAEITEPTPRPRARRAKPKIEP
jgi:uncharacterized membrane protein YeiH